MCAHVHKCTCMYFPGYLRRVNVTCLCVHVSVYVNVCMHTHMNTFTCLYFPGYLIRLNVTCFHEHQVWRSCLVNNSALPH